MRKWLSFIRIVVLVMACAAAAAAQVSPELKKKIDTTVEQALKTTGAPGASIAIVQNGQITYVQAYGNARLEMPMVPSRPEMKYAVGSISKQFTATAVLLLAEHGKLSLDDPVGKWVKGPTRANEVTIRQLLSHTSGYQDYWPQDYVPPFMLTETTPQQIVDRWAGKPLDFEPGTQWQYSNTNYVIAAMIVEKASGMRFMQFVKKNILDPLGIAYVDVDQQRLAASDAHGYLRYGLGPLRPAPKEGKGWLFGAAELAMTAGDLAKWDISLMERKLLRPASYDQLEREGLLKNGVGTQYALGLDVSLEDGRWVLGHGGEISGFTATNVVFPEQRVAIAVLVNEDAVSTSGQIAHGIAGLLLSDDAAETANRLARARAIFADLQKGKIDRSLFTGNGNAYFSEEALKDFASGLGPLGEPDDFFQVSQSKRGGMVERSYRAKLPGRTVRIWTFEMPDGKLEQYQVAAVQ